MVVGKEEKRRREGTFLIFSFWVMLGKKLYAEQFGRLPSTSALERKRKRKKKRDVHHRSRCHSKKDLLRASEELVDHGGGISTVTGKRKKKMGGDCCDGRGEKKKGSVEPRKKWCQTGKKKSGKEFLSMPIAKGEVTCNWRGGGRGNWII